MISPGAGCWVVVVTVILGGGEVEEAAWAGGIYVLSGTPAVYLMILKAVRILALSAIGVGWPAAPKLLMIYSTSFAFMVAVTV